MVVTINCRGMEPLTLRCTDREVGTTLDLEFDNDESFRMNVDYAIFVDGVQHDTGSLLIGDQQTLLVNHALAFEGPTRSSSRLVCGNSHVIEAQITSQEFESFAPVSSRSPAAALRGVTLRQQTSSCGFLFVEREPTEEEPVSADETLVSVADCSISPTGEVPATQRIDVSATLENGNDVDVFVDVIWRAVDNGVTVAIANEAFLPANGRETFSESFVAGEVEFLPAEWSDDVRAEVGFGTVQAAAPAVTASAPRFGTRPAHRNDSPSTALRSTRLLADGGALRKVGCGCGCGGGC